MLCESDTPLGAQMRIAHATYYQEMRKYRRHVNTNLEGNGPWGHVVSMGRNRSMNLENTWRAIAQKCLDAGVNAADFVIFSFSAILDNGNVVAQPNDLLRQELFDGFLSERVTSQESLKAYWRQQQSELLATSDRMNASVEWLLNHPFQCFEPWFRVLYMQPYSRVLHASWGEAAADQIRGDKQLREFLGTQTPENYQTLQDLRGERFVN